MRSARLRVLIGVLMVTLVAGVTHASATTPVRSAVDGLGPAVDCATLPTHDLTALVDAPTKILGATSVNATTQRPAYCRVTGYIAPQIQFELRLPTAAWSGRYLQLGCGGFCGFADPDNSNHPFPGSCAPPDDGRIAIAADNSGHVGASSTDGMWAMNDPQLRIDSGYRSEHALSIAAKKIIEIYYGQRPTYSYFAGCSNGGRQALMEAQRYPDDFDGIIAGAPGNNLTALAGEFFPWIAQANTDRSGRQILNADKLQLLNTKVLAACDASDGLTDNLLSDPRSCTFDPASIRCPNGTDRADCLTSAQVETVRKIYQGPVDDRGRRLFPDGLPRGTELAWLGYVVAPQGQSMSVLAALGLNYLKYFGSWDSPPATFTLDDHRFDMRTFTKLRQMSGIYDATDPDLSRFRDRGGKLLIWHGWSDPAIPATSSIAYYHAVTQRMGGPRATQEFARLFLFPGVYHCTGGHGPDIADMFTPMYDWVEHGKAPDRITATKKNGDQVVRTRPAFPYPLQTRYDGTGNPDDAANFVAAPPRRPADDTFPWLGDFRSGYRQTCHWEGTRLVCERTP